jgi:hypothetical protein
LDALRVPLDEQVCKGAGYDQIRHHHRILKYAVAAMHNVRPREMLIACLRLFPSEDEASKSSCP